jgi:2-(1,2-epoxy-1,2-dihydrophenyl)acetyl-CoA isomerase
VRIGLVPDAGSSYFLPRLVGMAKALELAMLGDKVSAADALRIGLVHEVIADGALADATAQLAARFIQGPYSVGLIKQLMRSSPEHDLDSQLRLEEETQYRAAQSSDFAEGVAAFVEKRSPTYRGQ